MSAVAAMRTSAALCLIGLSAIASGCAGRPASEPAAAVTTPPAAPVVTAAEIQTLRERTAAFWAARVANDQVKQWELLEPRGQGRVTALEYAGVPRAVKYIAYQVEDATVRGYFATVKVRLIVQPTLPTANQRQVPPAAVVIDDKWVRVRGTWYRSLEQEEGGTQTEAQAGVPR